MDPDQPIWTRIPEDWLAAPPGLLEQAKVAALTSLSAVPGSPAVDRLMTYYDPYTDFAGVSFIDILPNSPTDITGADLHATSLLLTAPLGPRATRRLLDDGPDRSEVLNSLRALPDVDLLVAGPDALRSMEAFQLAVQSKVSSPQATSPKAWEIASKLCARKRPQLFPLRDREVCGYLGLTPSVGHRTDWQVFRYLIGETEIIRAIDELVDAVRCRDKRLLIEPSRLRILDVAIRTFINH
jgi:Family of unknown function (DUF6308)